jgi:exosortase
MEVENLARGGRRQWCLLALILLSSGPLFAEHLYNLWRLKPHYQFFPLLLVGAGVLLWQRWPRTPPPAVPARLGAVFLGGGLMTLVAGVLVSSPWLAAVATLLSIAGMLFRLQGRAPGRSWLPVWAALWLLIPPPLGWDLLFIQRLQSFTSRAASLVLDARGVRHLMDGNVLVLPGQRLLVEEACSGVNSTFVLLAATALLAVAARRPILASGLLLISSLAWSALGNVVRVVAIAEAQAAYGIDLSSGWRHEVLGFCTFSFALWMVISTDQLLAFLLGPIALFDAGDPGDPDDLAFAGGLRLNPLTRIWNWLAGFRPLPASRALLRGAPAPGQESRLSAFGRGCVSCCFASGFAAVAVMQLAAWEIVVPSLVDKGDKTQTPARADLFQQADLPATLAGWTLASYATEEHGRTLGKFRHMWRYRSGRLECMISVDYPFGSWHDLTRCYVGAGWQVVEQQRWKVASTADPVLDRYLEVQLNKSTGEQGSLLFCNVQQATGEVLAGYSTFSWQRIKSRATHNLWWRRFSPDTGDILQIQAFVTPLDRGLPDRGSSAERDAIHGLFAAAGQRLLAVHGARHGR